MAVECIECLLGASTITARCRLFTNLFKNLKASYHCGLRAHAITLFKNFLHDAWLQASQSGLPSLYSGERQLNEDEMCTPFERRYLLPMCKDIFRFPLAECKESLLDQFSWLMAALNFILYVNIRAKNIDASLCDPAVAGLTTDVLQAVNMIDEEDKSCLKSSFINNINTELRQLIDRYSMAEKEHLASPDPKTLAPGAPSLEECRLTLLKLNLFSNTLGRLQEFQLV
ncbi:unnamed protein product [Dibothriocephalus latus]|uniref:Uncharacterized protein n=1 Tax=Dibothriocephalus latus TaxID=60516 RepID=A0A3P7LJD8_DIBLA|nr:unnamed protein product [Dibothriocephalus latus]